MGCVDGCMEGLELGCDDGFIEGCVDGCMEGFELGCEEGWPEGLEVG